MANGEWRMGNGQWAMGNGRWAMGDGRWAMGDGRWQSIDFRFAPGDAGFRRVVQRMGRLQVPKEVGSEIFGRFCGIADQAFSGVDLALAFEIEVFNRSGPSYELLCARFGVRQNFRELSEVWPKFRAFSNSHDHGAHFTRGASRDGDEGNEFCCCETLETFSDVVRNGKCGAIELVLKASRQTEGGLFEEIKDGIVKLNGFLPDGELIESLVFGHLFEFFGEQAIRQEKSKSASYNGEWAAQSGHG
jgi:hypothetical protein